VLPLSVKKQQIIQQKIPRVAMKKIVTITICALMALGAAAQTELKVANLERLKKDIANSDKDIANPKKLDKPKTWFDHGDMFVKVYEKSTMGVAPNMHKTLFAMLQKETETATFVGEEYAVMVFPNI
jgi:hypothetical protein